MVDGSCNDTAANGDISGYQAGDRIEITGALVQTWRAIQKTKRGRWICTENWAYPITGQDLAGPALQSVWTAEKIVLLRISEIRVRETLSGHFLAEVRWR